MIIIIRIINQLLNSCNVLRHEQSEEARVGRNTYGASVGRVLNIRDAGLGIGYEWTSARLVWSSRTCGRLSHSAAYT